jgi:hypothetical protein
MKDSKPRSPRIRKLALWALALLLLYTVLGFLILPPLVKSVALKQISQQLNRPVTIEKISINPFACSTTVRGLLVKDHDGQPFLSWDQVYVQFDVTSLFGGAWRFKEIDVTKPYARVEMNADRTFNFSDLVTKFSTNAAPVKTGSAKPLLLQIDQLHISRASASYTDFTPHTTFRRTLGPLDITLDNFRTDPDNKNPYAFTGTTDAGELISWNGYFYLSPLRSQGELKLGNFTLNKYAALYQDLVRFEIRGGTIALDVNYRFEMSPSNRVAAVDNTSFTLHDFKLGKPGDTNNLAELANLAVTGASGDLPGRTATVGSIALDGGKLFLRRAKDDSINVVEIAKPAESVTNAPEGILFLLRSVTNVVSLLLQSTNQWSGLVRSVTVTNCALHLEDDVNTRPAKLDLSSISLAAKNISNQPGTNLTASLALRWNTNGSIQTSVSASFLPPTAEVQVDLDQLDLGTLDPYLEPKLNLYILGSGLGLHGKINLTTPTNELPQVTFHGDASLDHFHTVDGVQAEDLVKWDSLRFSGIDANLNPQTMAIREMFVDNAYARLIIETNQTINVFNALRLATPSAADTNKTSAVAAPKMATENTPLPQITIGAIVISNTAVSFTDRSIQPTVDLSIQQINGRIAGLSTEQLQHADLALDAQIDGVGPAVITGTINPFSGTGTNHLKISVRDMDLTPTSPYSGKFAGYGIAEGKLNLDLTYDLVGKKLKSANVITLDRFTFGDKVQSPEATHLPVRLAVAILKDRNGKIVLDVPIEGSLDDPKFRIRKVVIRALVNILEKVATSPFSLLGAVFGGGGDQLAYQDFAPGSADLTPTDKTKLDSLAKGLYNRPALGLEIAGSIDSTNDRPGLQRATLDQEIRTREWTTLRQSGQATNSAAQIVLTPDIRAHWLEQLYIEKFGTNTPTEAVATNTTIEIAASTNAAAANSSGVAPAMAWTQMPQTLKGSMFLVRQSASVEATAPVISVAPTAAISTNSATSTNSPAAALPPTATQEAQLLATYTITDSGLGSLAANRAKTVQAYLLQTGKVAASRLFLKNQTAADLRRQGCRVYLQFR